MVRTAETNPIVRERLVREGLTQVLYANGLTLSIGTSDTHCSAKMFGVPLTVEVAVFPPHRGWVRLTEYDDVAQISIVHFEQLCDRMLTLPEDLDEAMAMLHHWAEF
tara:strand:- start:134 stop:454 length:321 start_codon:yes stop_codon:yes gene_type:complete